MIVTNDGCRGDKMRNKMKFPVLVLFFLSFLVTPTALANDDSQLKIDFDVQPSQEMIVKPADGNAKASLNFNIHPEGEILDQGRPPVDVVFLFDSSGSMKGSKLVNAKSGLEKALDYFMKEKQDDDRFSLVTFSTSASILKSLPLNGQFIDMAEHDVQTIFSYVSSIEAAGSTNYHDAFKKAEHIFSTSDVKRQKYIVFLTDGEPTRANVVEKVKVKECFFFCSNPKIENREVGYISDTSSSIYLTDKSLLENLSEIYLDEFKMGDVQLEGWYSRQTLERDVRNIKAIIKQRAFDVAKGLYGNGVTIHTIGYGQGDIDQAYLNLLSNSTSGVYSKADTDTITNTFEEIAQNVDSTKLEAEIELNISNPNVLIDNSAYKVENNKAYIPISNIVYKQNEGTPVSQSLSVPLEFKAEGEYLFDDIKIRYKTNDQTEWQYTDNKSATITVSEDAPAYITGNADVSKINQELYNLIIDEEGQRKTFQLTYNLTFGGLNHSQAKGFLQDIVIRQPLPDGISFADESFKPKIIDGQRVVEVPFNKMEFKNGAFVQSTLSKQFTLKADWAINRKQLPAAQISFIDSRSKDTTRKSILTADLEDISAKVRITQMNSPYLLAYDGYYDGTIKKMKITSSGEQEVAGISFRKGSSFPNLPVKRLNLSNPASLNISYKNDQIKELNFTPSIQVKDLVRSSILEDGATIQNEAEFSITRLVPGEDVTYLQKVEGDGGEAAWKEMNPHQTILISELGEHLINVKAEGGFAINAPVYQTLYIESDEAIRTPNVIELFVGDTVSFEIDVFPFGKPNNNYNVEIIRDPDDEINSSYSQVTSTKENKVTGITPGEDTMIVSTKNGKNQKRVRIIVKQRHIPLEGISFDKSEYKLALEGDDFEINSHLVFMPADATNKKIKEVIHTDTNVISIERRDGKWYVIPNNTGYSTVIVATEEGEHRASAVIQVKSRSDNDGGDEGNTNGRW
jgi:von Willebrand factor type A domain